LTILIDINDKGGKGPQKVMKTLAMNNGTKANGSQGHIDKKIFLNYVIVIL